MKKQIQVDSIKKRFFLDASDICSVGPQWIHTSYKEFISFFNKIPRKTKLTKHEVVIGAYFAYGWMPTMLRLGGNLSAAVTIANKARSAKAIISEPDLSQIASVINGSVVGASKLLHFINPKKYAIWDSRVYHYIHEKEPYQYRLNAPKAYSQYLDIVNEITSCAKFRTIQDKVENIIGYKVSCLRACEIIMFEKGKLKK